MQYIKSYNKLFESSYVTDWTEIKDIINVISDEFDFEFKQFKVFDVSSVGSDKIISFIFTSRECIISDLYNKDKDIYRWFIKQIVDIGSFTYIDDTSPKVVKIRENFRVSYDYYSSRSIHKKIVFPDLTDVVIYVKSNIYEYHFNFKSNVFSYLDWVIKNPNDKELLKDIDPSIFIKHLFQYYCRSNYDFDFNILSVYSSKNKLLTPVKNADIRLPHNLSSQFKIDITPIFLKKVYNASGLIFRLEISTYDEISVTRTDRMRGYSISEETDMMLKSLGLDMTWRDIFII